MKKRLTKEEKARDKEIERLYGLHAQGKHINILDIPKVFAMAKHHEANGSTLEEGVKAAIATYCTVAP